MEDITVTEAKSVSEIAADYSKSHEIVLPGQQTGKPSQVLASEAWMEGYIACEEEKDILIEELRAEKDRIIEAQKKEIAILTRRLEILEDAFNKSSSGKPS